MKKTVPLNWIRAFAQAAKYCNFTLAAKDLNITQAALSKQIRALESHLSCQLFQRHPHGLKLTEQGRRYWQDTQGLVSQLDQVTRQFMLRRQTQKIHLRSNISFSTLLLMQHLQAFRAIHPEVVFDITHDVWESMHTPSNIHIDIGYRLLENCTTSAQHHLLASGTLLPMMAAGFKQEAVLNLPLIHVAGYYREWHWWLEHIQQMPVAIDHPLIQRLLKRKQRIEGPHDWCVDNSLSASQLAIQGQGLILGRAYLLQNLLQSGQLQVLEGLPALTALEGFVIHLTPLGQEHASAQQLFEYLCGL